MKKDWDRFFKKMLLNSTYGGGLGNPEIIDKLVQRVQNEMKIQKRDEKIDKLLE